MQVGLLPTLLQNQELGPSWYAPSFLVQCQAYAEHLADVQIEDSEMLPGHRIADLASWLTHWCGQKSRS